MNKEQDREEANKLLLAYAIEFVYTQPHGKTIGTENRACLIVHVNDGTCPNDELLERCFPHTCERIGRLVYLDELQKHGEISHADYVALEESIHCRETLDPALANKYFTITPKQMRNYRTLAHVVRYFRVVYMNKPNEKHAVQIAIVATHTKDARMVPIRMVTGENSELVYAFNESCLSIYPGCRVILCGNTIAEIEPRAKPILIAA